MSRLGRVAHVVGVGLEGEAEHPDASCRPRSPPQAAMTLPAMALLALSLIDGGLDQPDGRSGVAARSCTRAQGVLREARAAIAGAGVQELGADALVEADAARDLLHVRADGFAEIGHLVDEGDLHGEEGVGRVFDQLGGPTAVKTSGDWLR
jgi:hypothetical protein